MFLFELLENTSTNVVSAEQVWGYVSKIHPKDQQGGGFLKRLIMRHPQYELKRVPLSSINIPDQELDGEEQQEPYDPYGRAMFIDPEHAGEYSQYYIDKRPIVIDTRGNILDGSHRAWAAAMLMNRKDIMAYVPVLQLNELFQQGKQNWTWKIKADTEAIAKFTVGDRDYMWMAYSHFRDDKPNKWEIQFRAIRQSTDPEKLELYGKTGTGNSAEVMSTAVDITREFLQYYGNSVEQLSFDAKEDSRIQLYRRMVQRLLPNWEADEEYSREFGLRFTLTRPKSDQQSVTEGRSAKQDIEEFLYSLTPDDVGVEQFGNYRVHYEGFTDDCKSSGDYRRNPDKVYQQVYRDFIKRENGERPVKSGMLGSEEYPILYSVFRVPKSKTVDTAEKAYSIAYRKQQPWPPDSREEKLIRSDWQLSQLYDQYILKKKSKPGITEAFDQPYPIEWSLGDHGDYDAYAELDDGTGLEIAFLDQQHNSWMVDFFRDSSTEITGEGDAYRVFATVLTSIRQFIDKQQPAKLNFSAEKQDDPRGSRARLYDRMIQRYIGGTGYNLTKQNYPDGAVYTLTRSKPALAEDLNESLSRVAYHYTNISSAQKILMSGNFELSSALGSVEQQYAPPGKPYFLSTTRTKLGDYHRSRGSSYGVIFVLNGDWFNQRYKSGPVDYWQNRNPSGVSHRGHEAEDRVFSSDPTIPVDGVTAIHVLANKDSAMPSYNAVVRNILIAAKARDIATYFYNDPTPWMNLDTRHLGDVSMLKGQAPHNTHFVRRGKLEPHYLEHWIELMMKSDKSQLSKKADRMVYGLSYGYYKDDAINALGNELANARKPDSGPERDAVIKIIQYMKHKRLNTIADFVNNIAEKWKSKTS